jgi:hypothetical protein
MEASIPNVLGGLVFVLLGIAGAFSVADWLVRCSFRSLGTAISPIRETVNGSTKVSLFGFHNGRQVDLPISREAFSALSRAFEEEKQ